MLTLATQPAPTVPTRSLIPACLQPLAPHSYEIYDETGNRLQPTLSGYKLKPGLSYYLKVRAQDNQTADWKLRLLAPRSHIDARNDDYTEDKQRAIQFHVLSRSIWEQLMSRISMLPVHLEHADGRELYRFEIPVVLTMHRSMWLLSLIGVICTPMSFLFHESPLWTRLLGLVGVICLFFIGLTVWDFWCSYRRGRQLLKAVDGR